MQKKIPTLIGLIIILVFAVIVFGGVFTWQYFIEKNKLSFAILPTCVSEGENYHAPENTSDLCCPGLVEQPTSQSGTIGICVKPKQNKENVGWKIYTNNIKKYQISYIEGTDISENSSSNPKGCVSLSYKKGYIIIRSPGYDELCGNTSAPADVTEVRSTILVGGTKYKTFGYITKDITESDTGVTLADGTFIDFGFYDDAGKATTQEYKNVMNVVDQMISTFKFTK